MVAKMTWFDTVFSAVHDFFFKEKDDPTNVIKFPINFPLKTNNSKLNDLHPVFRQRLIKFLKICEEHDLVVDVFEGHRSFSKQKTLYDIGRVKPGKKVTNARPGFSWHNHGLAADIVFKPKGKWSWAEKHDWETLGRLGKMSGLEWGGDWKMRDRPHFQYTNGLKISQAYRINKGEGLQGVWEEINKLKKE
jgi:peptidoglycan LD-endopeptidase CwlK